MVLSSAKNVQELKKKKEKKKKKKKQARDTHGQYLTHTYSHIT